MKIIAIDPGVTQCSAIYADTELFDLKILDVIAPISTGNNWWQVTAKSVEVIGLWVSNLPVEDHSFKIAIEEPINRGRGNILTKQGAFLGALLYEFRRYKHKYLVNPMSAKIALTGSGASDKEDMMLKAYSKYEINYDRATLAQRESIADAIGIGLAIARKLSGVTKL